MIIGFIGMMSPDAENIVPDGNISITDLCSRLSRRGKTVASSIKPLHGLLKVNLTTAPSYRSVIKRIEVSEEAFELNYALLSACDGISQMVRIAGML
jgi:hypothetical protein